MNAEAMVVAEAAEAVRLTALKTHAILDTAPEAQFDALVAEAARICETPIALVSVVDEHRQWFKARVGLQASQTTREQALCELACDWLESLGYQPTGVHSPAAALERLAAEPFDILFTDTPGLPGTLINKPYRKADLLGAIATTARASLTPP